MNASEAYKQTCINVETYYPAKIEEINIGILTRMTEGYFNIFLQFMPTYDGMKQMDSIADYYIGKGYEVVKGFGGCEIGIYWRNK